MLVVSDTSPISSLVQIGRCELLQDLFGIVCIPVAVQDELAKFHSTLPQFIEIRNVIDRTQVESLLTTVHLGEAEAIVLAAETHADRLLIDERRGREAAAKFGVPVIGLLGVLLLAKERALISSVSDCLLELQTKAGFYVSAVLMQKTLEAAGE